MKITITDTPITLAKALENAGYVPRVSRDAGVGILIKNDQRTYDGWAQETLPGTDTWPIMVEWAALHKYDWGTNPLGEPTYIEQWWYDAPVGEPAWEERYITETEGIPVFSGDSLPFSCYDPNRVHLVACAGKTVDIYVFIE